MSLLTFILLNHQYTKRIKVQRVMDMILLFCGATLFVLYTTWSHCILLFLYTDPRKDRLHTE